MKTTQHDIPYCGVSEKRIKEAKPVLRRRNMEEFVRYIAERYNIHIKRDVLKKEPPYTKDPILEQYRFTNVKRIHDTQSIALMNCIADAPADQASLEDKIVNIFLFRAWNNWKTFRFFGLLKPARKLYNPKFKERARKIYKRYCEENPSEAEERRWFSAAYNQGGMKSAWKFPQGDGYQRVYQEEDAAKFSDWEPDILLRPFHIPVWLKRDGIVDEILAAESQSEVFEAIKKVRGFSGFMAYQIFVDLTYINDFRSGEVFKFSENEFTVAGPGCVKGLEYLFQDSCGLTPEEQIFWLRDKQDKLFARYGDGTKLQGLMTDLSDEDRFLSVMDIENCLCEIGKYLRAKQGGARPKERYKGIPPRRGVHPDEGEAR